MDEAPGGPCPFHFDGIILIRNDQDGAGMTDEQTPTAPPARPHTLNFWSRLHRKQIAVHINGQPMITGELTAYSTYEIIVLTKNGREVLIPKGQILSVDLPEGWRRAAGREEESADGQ